MTTKSEGIYVFLRFYIGFCNCSDSVVFLVSHYIELLLVFLFIVDIFSTSDKLSNIYVTPGS